MPVDHSQYRFACEICGEEFESRKREAALASAAHCESGGAPPEPLPAGTLIVSDGFERGGDAGGLRFARVVGHELRSHYSRYFTGDRSGHYIEYEVADGARNTTYTSENLHPHKPGLLNAHSGLAGNVIHADRLETVLRDPARARELAKVLALFGAKIPADELKRAAHEFYGQIDFASRHTDDERDEEGYNLSRYLHTVGPLTKEQLELLKLVCVPAERLGKQARYSHDPRGDDNFPALDDNRWFQATHAFALHRFAGSVAKARAFTHTRSHPQISLEMEAQLELFFEGEPVAVPAHLLLPAPGSTKEGRKFGAKQLQAVRELLGPERLAEMTEDNNGRKPSFLDPKDACLAVVRHLSKGVAIKTRSRLIEQPYLLAVASGKGGVGKSTVAASVAMAATARGLKAAILDLDFHGPSQPALLGLEPGLPLTPGGKIIPSTLPDGTLAFSLGQLVSDETPIDWRGAAVEGFVLFIGANLDLEDCDLVVLDLPPGTGEVERAVVDHLCPDGTLLVTTGSHLSHADCRRTAHYLAGHTKIVGVVENLSRRDVTLPDGTVVEGRLFGAEGDTQAFVDSLGLEHFEQTTQSYEPFLPAYLGSLPFDPDPAALAGAAELTAVLDVVCQAVSEPRAHLVLQAAENAQSIEHERREQERRAQRNAERDTDSDNGDFDDLEDDDTDAEDARLA